MEKYITHAARERLVRKLQALQKSARDIGKKKAEAAGEGLTDWHDNFELEQLDRDYQLINGRIADLNKLISGCQTVEAAEQNQRAAVGTTVEFLLDGQKDAVTIGCLGESESEFDLTPYDSPLGQILMGLHESETKTGFVGKRSVSVTVVCIHPPSFRYNEIQQQLNARSEAASQAGGETENS